MHSLFDLFETHISKEQQLEGGAFPPKEYASIGEGFDGETDQLSLVFSGSPRVIYVCSRSLEIAFSYEQLGGIPLTEEEEAVRAQTFETIKSRNPKAFDGDQLVATDIIFDETANTLYFVVKRIKYSLLTALRQGAFGAESHLNSLNFACLGVILSCITTDDATVCMERKQLGLYSQVAGFTGPIGIKGGLYLNFPGTNLPIVTANTEMFEELLGQGEPTLAQQFGFDLSGRKFEWSPPQITALSMRRTKGRNGWTAECLATTNVNCTANAIQHVLSNNLAKDAGEHTGQSTVVSLKPSDRQSVGRWLASDSAPIGKPLYPPTIFAAAHGRYGAPFPGSMAGTKCSAMPTSCLFARPQRTPKLPHAADDQQHDSRLVIRNGR